MLMNSTEIPKAKEYLTVMKKYPHLEAMESGGQENYFGDHVHLQRYAEE